MFVGGLQVTMAEEDYQRQASKLALRLARSDVKQVLTLLHAGNTTAVFA